MSQYTEDYIEKCFYIWYENGRVIGGKLIEKLPRDTNNKIPTDLTLRDWAANHGWVERADALDAQVSMALDTQVIDKRIAMYKRHAEIGEDMVELGVAFLKENGIKSDQAAIRAIDSGVEIQRVSVGQAEVWQKIAKMSDEQLTKELERLTGKIKDKEFDVDVEPEEIP